MSQNKQSEKLPTIEEMRAILNQAASETPHSTNGQQLKPPKTSFTAKEIELLKEDDFPKIWEFLPPDASANQLEGTI